MLRRDLTINTLVLDEFGSLLDLFNGKNDLKSKRILHVSFAFLDDSLRILRIFRFLIKYFSSSFFISSYTESFIKKIVFKGEILNFTFERVFKEIFLSLHYKNAFLFFSLLYKFRLLKFLFYDLNLLFFFLINIFLIFILILFYN